MIRFVVEKTIPEKLKFIWEIIWSVIAFPIVWILCLLYMISQLRLSAFAEMHRLIVRGY